ncbi:MAG TPA: DHA2 family efflux MFS transporter permease subunit [Rhizomicrobium sp.]|nr:DHA2 family efflux MFS transporter permease subunit [Rhizomicrobium sp.]
MTDAAHTDYTAIPNRALITVSVMLATFMQALDSTIANVALPHIQSSLAATQDEGAWVLTSYIVAAAVMFPLTGWLANAYGRREVFLVSITIFVVASALCGAASSLPQLVLFRVMQGLGGAALVPLSQAILFEINAPKDYGRAMSIWGVGATLAPILGPALGGWLTDNYSWRWVFYINLPIGMLTFAGLFLSLPRSRKARPGRFDFFGFATLSLAVASLQLMLDRGQLLDWFSSREILIESVIAALGFYIFFIHMLSSEKPFVTPALFRDRNFVAANIFLFLIGIVLFATLALLPPLLQSKMNYPVVLAGLVIAPRGFGTIAGMFLVGRLVPRFDARIIMAAGLCLTAFSLWQMTHYSLLMDTWPVIVAGVFQGAGIGAINVCLSAVAFITLPAKLRNEGTAISNLIRSIGAAIGISVMVFLLTQNIQRVHASLAEHVTAYNMSGNAAAASAHMDIGTAKGLIMLNQLITDQGTMIAYIDDFRLMMILTLLTIPFLLLFRRAKP